MACHSASRSAAHTCGRDPTVHSRTANQAHFHLHFLHLPQLHVTEATSLQQLKRGHQASGLEIIAFPRGLFLIINKDVEIRQPMYVFRVSVLNVRNISAPSTPTSVLSTKPLWTFTRHTTSPSTTSTISQGSSPLVFFKGHEPVVNASIQSQPHKGFKAKCLSRNSRPIVKTKG